MGDVVSSIINSSPADTNDSPTGETELQTGEQTNQKPTNPLEQPKEDDRVASRFAALSKKERSLLEREQKLKTEYAEYEEWKKSKEAAKQDPLAYLEKSGLKLEDVIYSGLGSKPEPTVEEKIKQLQDRLEEKERQEVEGKKKSEEERINNQVEGFKSQISKHIKENAEKYELINLANAEGEVYDLIAEWLDKTSKEGKPQLLSIEDAATKIEDYYEQHTTEIFSKSKKLAAKYKPIEKDTPKPNPVSPTLTNRHASKPESSQVAFSDPNMSFEHKREASIKRSAQLLEELQQQQRRG